MVVKHELNKSWTFSLAKFSSLFEKVKNKRLIAGKQFVAAVPGTIHTDLLNNNLIDDPYYSNNESKLNWIPECDWVYQIEFNFNKKSKSNIDLVFEGLDTICDVFLNNQNLGRS